MPWMMGDEVIRDAIVRLPEGVTLAEAHPEAFGSQDLAPAVEAPLPVQSVLVTQPAVSPSAPLASTPALSLDTSSGFRGPSPVLLPPARTASRSPVVASPARATSSPVVPPVVSRSPSTGSGAGPVPPSTPGSASSPSVPLPSTGSSRTVRPRRAVPTTSAASDALAAPESAKFARVGFFFSSAVRFLDVYFQCERCRQQKKKCSLITGAPGPCTLCTKAGAECVPARTTAGASLFCPCLFSV